MTAARCDISIRQSKDDFRKSEEYKAALQTLQDPWKSRRGGGWSVSMPVGQVLYKRLETHKKIPVTRAL